MGQVGLNCFFLPLGSSYSTFDAERGPISELKISLLKRKSRKTAFLRSFSETYRCTILHFDNDTTQQKGLRIKNTWWYNWPTKRRLLIENIFTQPKVHNQAAWSMLLRSCLFRFNRQSLQISLIQLLWELVFLNFSLTKGLEKIMRFCFLKCLSWMNKFW